MADIASQHDQTSPTEMDESHGNGSAQPEARGVKRSRSGPADDDDDDDDKIFRERRKIEIKFISDKSRRHITFSKRKAGIMKKVSFLLTPPRCSRPSSIPAGVLSPSRHAPLFALHRPRHQQSPLPPSRVPRLHALSACCLRDMARPRRQARQHPRPRPTLNLAADRLVSLSRRTSCPS